MIVLGINFGHDAAASLIVNGKILASIEEEKISRVKQDFGWPDNALKCILNEHNVSPADVDIVSFGGYLYDELGTQEIRYRFSRSKSAKNKEYVDRVMSYIGLGGDRFSKKNISVFEDEVKKKGFTKAKLLFYKHHLCHAAGGHYCAPFDADLTITCDGLGDSESFNFYICDNKQGLKAIKVNRYDMSVGAFYSVITELLGFRPTRHEGKITGLAAYGKPTRLVDDYKALFKYDTDGNMLRYPFGELKNTWKKESKEYAEFSLSQRINILTSESLIGMDYSIRYILLKQKVKELSIGFSKEDMSYACQKVAEMVVVEEVKNVIAKHFNGKKVKVTLAGGVFANVRINQMVFELDEVENVFVHPAMGDSGLALGAAILADIDVEKRKVMTKQYVFNDTYIGPNFDKEVPEFVKTISHEADVELMQQPAKEIAQMMKDNLVVGFWQGSMEWGPRALGKRSMILNTFDRTVNDSVNKRLSRTEFMPFAPSIIDYMMKTYIPSYDPSCPAADYMTITYDVAKEHHEQLQAVVHVDGTARPQAVSKETNPYYYDIIDEFYKLTGCGAIVNTSFNAHEEPIVSTPSSAYKALKEDRIDVLVLDKYKVVMKKKNNKN